MVRLLLIVPFLMPQPIGEISEVLNRPHQDVELSSVLHLYQNGHRCTAFVIEDGLVATAAHCIDPKGPITLLTVDGKKIQGKPLYVGRVEDMDDVAVLEADTKGLKSFKVGQGEVQMPNMCLFLGYASEDHQMTLPCIITGIGEYGYDMFGQPRSGDSGGPLLGADGVVVGVVTRSNGDLFGAATTLELLQHAIDEAHAKLH